MMVKNRGSFIQFIYIFYLQWKSVGNPKLIKRYIKPFFSQYLTIIGFTIYIIFVNLLRVPPRFFLKYLVGNIYIDTIYFFDKLCSFSPSKEKARFLPQLEASLILSAFSFITFKGVFFWDLIKF